ncbi:WD40 repeat-like protein [Suillus fuscotomentosus]|uniref:WD40 repeat-like protein n=1 Tax=Suillus fuscotomentosus TaxID=1912939 RepID=A0AAD4HPZ4_9AGAM|nr:WD40 repeat-like protein [Suillus fuscotomentosus]KAG1905805.1 WD40 repeat-like protein [Suillus fuscotomentosus]
MAHSDSEGETIDDLEFDTRTTDGDAEEENDIDEDLLAIHPNYIPGSFSHFVCTLQDSPSDDSEDDEDDEDESEPPAEVHLGGTSSSSVAVVQPDVSKSASVSPKPPTPEPPKVEAIGAIPHPVPTHALASSFCMTHLLTGSDDGFIRDYDIFATVNGKTTLTAPQRHHCNVVEGNMKAGQIRSWWENPDFVPQSGYPPMGHSSPCPVYSLAMHSDAIWALGGANRGHINLFTVRHDPGRLVHVLANGHRGPISALSIDHDEKGFFSAGWDGEATQWDLNTGQGIRRFTAHGAQLVAIAVRPLGSPYYSDPVSSAGSYGSYSVSQPIRENDISRAANAEPPIATTDAQFKQSPSVSIDPLSNHKMQDADAKSDASFDPLFDGEPDADGEFDNENPPSDEFGALRSQVPQRDGSAADNKLNLAVPEVAPHSGQQVSRSPQSSVAPPKNAPPLLNASNSATFSPDILMIAAIDGQIMLWDKRVNSQGTGVGRLWMSEKTPPWCVSACWSTDGSHIYAGRRNGTVDVWDVRLLGYSGPNCTPRLLKSLRNPPSSGVVSCVVPFPDGRHIACASTDNIRLWNAVEAGEVDGSMKSRGGVQFKIIPGHHGGYVSQMLVDPGGRFLVSASSNRGWHGDSTRTVFVHDIKPIR